MKILKSIWRLFWKRGTETTIRDAIEELIEENGENTNDQTSDSEMEMLGNVLDLRDTQVQEIMVPRVEIRALPITANIDDIMREFIANQISSVLVYKGTIDNVLGVVYLKDAINYLKMNKTFNVSMFIKNVLFVPPTMRTLDLLLQMKSTGIKVAVVVDEYGGVDGFCAFSDVVETIIGDIQDADEKKQIKHRIIKNTDGTFIVDARLPLYELTKILGLNITSPDKSIDTIGGYVSLIAEKVPVKGELVKGSGMDFEILDSDPRHIKTIKIRWDL